MLIKFSLYMRVVILIKYIWNRFFYSPYRAAKKNRKIILDDSAILMRSCRFVFESKENSNSIVIAQDAMVGCEFIFESDVGRISVGKGTFINAGTRLISREKISIGSNVTIAWGCTIYDHNSHSINYIDRRNDLKQQLKSHRDGLSFIEGKDWSTVSSLGINIENDVWIGFGCTILKGVTIGEGSIVGAGSVVREHVEPWSIVAGNPAKLIKRIRDEK
ncbi:acyltransferase [Amphritea pacifica]|uniref:acyltransferase n=1 Tax=Amphritea pacifica TaxID=2811233 RepID=UPI001E3A10C4|nr:acyltransferase [Amphritea pacifica]